LIDQPRAKLNDDTVTLYYKVCNRRHPAITSQRIAADYTANVIQFAQFLSLPRAASPLNRSFNCWTSSHLHM